MLRNSAFGYGSVAKWLHWLIAIWVLTAYVIILYLDARSVQFPLPGLNYHKAVGLTILIPVLLRLVWRFLNPVPKLPADMPRWQRRAAGLSHSVLYFLLLAMPLSGYIGNGGGVDYGFFRVPPFARTPMAAWINDTFGITYAQLHAKRRHPEAHVAGQTLNGLLRPNKMPSRTQWQRIFVW